MLAVVGIAAERQYLWPEGKMPDAQDKQFARMTDEKGSTNKIAYIEWLAKPENPNGGIIIMISGGAYQCCCDIHHVRKMWPDCFGKAGFQMVNLCYRTPRPEGLPIYQTAWEDGQRAVRMVRAEAKKRGLNPENIGVVSMSAGSHLATLLATSSQTPAYEAIDDFDKIPSADLVVTSYALLQRDFEQAYYDKEFSALVIDEAQHIKNRDTKNAKAVKAIRIGRGYWYIALYPLVTKLELQHLQLNSISVHIPDLQLVINRIAVEWLAFLVVDMASDGVHLHIEGSCSLINVIENQATVFVECHNPISVCHCSSIHP